MREGKNGGQKEGKKRSASCLVQVILKLVDSQTKADTVILVGECSAF